MDCRGTLVARALTSKPCLRFDSAQKQLSCARLAGSKTPFLQPTMTTPGDDTVDPWNKDTKTKFERQGSPLQLQRPLPQTNVLHSKSRSEFLDPCQEAATKSIRCLHRNGGDRSMCQDYFQSVCVLTIEPAQSLTRHILVVGRIETARSNGYCAPHPTLQSRPICGA